MHWITRDLRYATDMIIIIIIIIIGLYCCPGPLAYQLASVKSSPEPKMTHYH